MKVIASLVLFSVFVSPLAIAKIVYKTTHADGTVSFSDTFVEGAVKVDLSSTKTTVLPTQLPSQTRPSMPSNGATISTPPKPAIDYQLSIIQPAPEATIRNNQGKVTITAQVSPEIQGEYLLTIRDKKIRSRSGQFMLDNLDRGTYPYQINLINNSGKVIASSNLQRFYLHKASVLIKPPANGSPR